MRLGFVVQRYGLEVTGGSELHCRWFAERLAGRHDVEVFTSRAEDYLDWRDTYPGGSSEVNGVRVHRFGVRRPRNLRAFASLSEVVFHQPHTREEEERWFTANGPDAPRLLEALKQARARFDLFLFYSYRYAHAFYGVRALPDQAVLVPTAEEDPAIGLGASRELFRLPRGLVFLTPEEQELVEGASGTRSVPSVVVGTGLPPLQGAALPRTSFHPRPFILYVGRIDANKGCGTLFAYFQRFAKESSAEVDLVVAGQEVLRVPDHPRIRHVGRLTEAEKEAALQECRLLVMPSPLESLSIILLEAWRLGAPSLVNARCRVLEGQSRRSNGGLFYRSYAEFKAGLELLLAGPHLAKTLGRQGREYVAREYSWERVDAILEPFLAGLASRPA